MNSIRWSVAVALAVVAVALPAPAPLRAHHGFIGQHEFSRPLYLAGRVTRTYVGFPHARLTIQLPEKLRLPRSRERMRPLEDAEARQTITLLKLVDGKGQIEVSLDQRMTRRLIDDSELLRVGDAIEAVSYRRTSGDEYGNELHVVWMLLRDQEMLVSSSPAVAHSPARAVTIAPTMSTVPTAPTARSGRQEP